MKRVCLLSADCQRVLMTYSGRYRRHSLSEESSISSGVSHYDDDEDVDDRPNLDSSWIADVAVDQWHGFIYVAEYDKQRVSILNNDLAKIGQLSDGDRQEPMKSPYKLCLDVDNSRLYVAEIGGSIGVYSIHQRFREHQMNGRQVD